MRTLSCVLVWLVACTVVPRASAQNPLDEAKAQYTAAAYEEALATLTRAARTPPVNRIEVEQYRAFCLIALGRMTDAERAVAALVAADPKYAPSPNVASPRVLSLVSEMRARELPAIARGLLDTGREAFQQKDFARAQAELTLLLQLLGEDSMKGRPETADLRVLAEGFVTLADARLAEARAAEARAAETRAAQASLADAGAGPSAPAAAARELLTPPVPIQQDPPAWIPPNTIAGSREYEGAIRVRIGADGRVKSASIEQPTYPSYDARLLEASRSWIYRPATRNGEPVESERVIPIQLRPK